MIINKNNYLGVLSLLFVLTLVVIGITTLFFANRPVIKTVIVDSNKALDENYNDNPQAFWHWIKDKHEQIEELKNRVSELELLEKELSELESRVKSYERN